ncbi:hypothetical protein [Actinomadura sp. 3N407]|uniref:hypothetical protein n=1 Tax=Actinomadura sp. 3N407 TaxID=3457423 RepID=UPI003FCC3A7E
MDVSLRNLMARMGHDNERAALRYQHRSNSADRAIADGLNALVQADQKRDGDGRRGHWCRGRSCTLIARR